MLVTLEELKQYLHVDSEDDDIIMTYLIGAAERLCLDVLRMEDTAKLQTSDNVKTAVLYAAAYLYEHREEANHNDLTLTLRALLFGLRNEVF